MSLLIAWSFFHKLYEPESELSRNFLVIAPNIIVLDRLRADFDGLRIFFNDPMLPENGHNGRNWRDDFQMTLHIQDDVRNGVAEIFMEVEPLAGSRHVEVTETRTRMDWACFVRDMLDIRYPDAEKVVLVMDNLNTHGFASFYEAFKPEEARRLSERLEIHYTPKHGSWLNVAEIELSVLKRLYPKL